MDSELVEVRPFDGDDFEPTGTFAPVRHAGQGAEACSRVAHRVSDAHWYAVDPTAIDIDVDVAAPRHPAPPGGTPVAAPQRRVSKELPRPSAPLESTSPVGQPATSRPGGRRSLFPAALLLMAAVGVGAALAWHLLGAESEPGSPQQAILAASVPSAPVVQPLVQPVARPGDLNGEPRGEGSQTAVAKGSTGRPTGPPGPDGAPTQVGPAVEPAGTQPAAGTALPGAGEAPDEANGPQQLPAGTASKAAIATPRSATTARRGRPPRRSARVRVGKPTREEVLAGFRAIRGAVGACVAGRHGVADVRARIASGGQVTYSVVNGDFAGTPAGTCIARAVRKARFPKFSGEPFEVGFPYRF